MRSLVTLGVALLCAAGVHAQRPVPQAAVVPEAITVGDVFHAAIRLDLPAGVQLAAPDSLVLPEDLEHAGRRELRFDTAAAAADGSAARRVTVVYPLTAWRPGSYELPPLALRLVGDGAATTLAVQLPSFEVRSVLPADTAGIEPQPARDVLGPNRLWWPIVLALLLAALVMGGLYYWWRRRRRPPVEQEVAPAIIVLPRAAALERLAELRRSGLIERGEMKPYYEQLTETLRHYAASLSAAWSTDLTTAELSALPASRRVPHAMDLLPILQGADMVKFARAPATQEGAWRDLDAAVAWIERAEPEQHAAGTDDRRVA
jgi:hypothetical protein